MLGRLMKLCIGTLLVALIATSAISLHAFPTSFRVCPFPTCAVLPGGGQLVYCKLGRTGPLVIRYLNQCCCGTSGSWENMYALVHP